MEYCYETYVVTQMYYSTGFRTISVMLHKQYRMLIPVYLNGHNIYLIALQKSTVLMLLAKPSVVTLAITLMAHSAFT